jgi:uncharacterized damage-inducible protein DinB
MNSDSAIARIFLDEAASFLQEDFLPKIEKCIGALREEDVWWRSSETENSAGNLLLHLAGNVRQWIVSGMGGAADVRERPKEFAARGGITKDEALERLRATVAEACAVLRRLDPADLSADKKIQGFSRSGLASVFHVVEHFSYHTGQIAFITKLRTQRDLRFYDL